MNDLGRLLEALGRDRDERLSVNYQLPGGAFQSKLTTVGYLIDRETLPQDRSVWYGAAPVHPRVTRGRGGVRDVTGLRELSADLDVSAGKVPSWTVAEQIIQELSTRINTWPVAVVATGHGLQPHWRIARGPETDWPDETDPRWLDAVALVRRWGRLVADVAESLGASVDSVYDLARVLRAPGTINHKSDPVPVEVTWTDSGDLLGTGDLRAVLDEWRVSESAADREVPAVAVSVPESWRYAGVTCGYARRMIHGWPGDRPEARHPWLVAQAARLWAAVRHGCLTETDHATAVEVLREHFTWLLEQTGQGRPPTAGEFTDAVAWGRGLVAAMSDERVATELGGHPHQEAEDLSFDPSPESSSDGSAPTTSPGEVGEAPAAEPEEVPDPREPGLSGHMRMAELLGRKLGHTMRYVHRIGWHVWPKRGTHWVEDSDGMPVRALRYTFQELLKYAAQKAKDGDEEWSEAIVKMVQSSCSKSAVTGILELAGSLDPFAKSPDALDADRDLLNTPTGTFSLTEMRLRPHSRDDLITKVAGAGPDFAADQTAWLAFLARILPDPEVRGFVQRLLGSALLGRGRDHVLPVWHGTGRNGKSVLLRVMRAAFGSYATIIGADTLLSQKHSQHPTGLMGLRGARLAFASETDRGRRLNAALVKGLTGGDPIVARRMHKDEVTWEPTQVLIMVTNHAPAVDPDDEAMMARVLIVPFDVVIPAAEQDPDLGDKLIANHLGAVMAWLIEGLREYRSRGLAVPDAVRARTETYRTELDAYAAFLAERTQRHPVAEVKSVGATALYAAWVNWRHERGEHPGNIRDFAQTLAKRGYKTKRTETGMHWLDITLSD